MIDTLSYAAAASPQTGSVPQREFLAFKLGAEEYGIDILRVQEIRSYEEPTRIAGAPPFVKGVVNLRGVIVPVLDMRVKFDLPQARCDDLTVVIVLNLGERVVGMVVDAVSDVITPTPEQLRPVPEFNAQVDTEHLLAIGAIGDRMLILLDIDTMMASPEMGLAPPPFSDPETQESSMHANTLKLSTRLSLAFAALLLLAVSMGAFALWSLFQVHQATLVVADNVMPSIKQLGDIRTAANQIRRLEGDHVIVNDVEELKRVEDQMSELRIRLTDKLKAYEPLLVSDQERSAYGVFRQRLDAYYVVQDRLLPLSRDSGAVEEAGALYRGESLLAFSALIAEIEQLVEFNEKDATAAVAAQSSSYATAFLWMLIISGVLVLLAITLAVMLVRGVTRQLGGEPADAAAFAQRVADGDLSAEILLREGDANSLLASLRRMQENLAAIVQGVRTNAESVATASGQISQGNGDLSSHTEQQASALQQTAASMKQLASTVRQNADNAQQGNELAVSASAVAERGGQVVGEVVQTMKGINDSSRKIADIIGVIDGIAFQTNILALNAAVEAARAGEQGRGFAVVAGEVRTLAQRSADAAKEIKGLITASVERVEQGSALVDQAGATMSEVVTSIRRVTDLMGEISAASKEQSAGVAQVGEAVAQMDQATQQNAALVEQSAAAAESLKTQAQQLVSAVAVFKLAGYAQRAAAPEVTPLITSNVVRPAFKPRAVAPAAAPLPPSRTGTDDWTSF